MKLYKKQLKVINDKINNLVEEKFKDKSKLLEMIKHALYGGKRLRAVIPIVISSILCKKIDLTKLSICIELFHNCSLIIDDLPCMDNDNYRRNRETVHYKYGLVKAQLLVNILLNLANNLLYENIEEIKKQDIYPEEHINNISLIIQKNINDNLGLFGAATGQFIDTCPINSFLTKKEYIKDYNSLDNLLNLIHLKTTTLFEISFVASYLLSGGEIKNIDLLKKAVRYFGLAFQISDDFEDIEQDMKRNLDEQLNPNLVCKYGKEKILTIYKKSVNSFKTILKDLHIDHEVFNEILQFLQKRIDK